MRGILLYILFFLGLSVAGCRGGRSYDSRLAAADSLVVSQPDSALRILRSVGFDSMCSDADRAYFALLLTQAKYKCDETITSTDTIDIAVDYFSGGGDADKRLRSLIYRGASLTDMGEITAAMEAYKQAEAAASPDDYENLGYINLRMASLYQKVYSDGREYIDKYRKALHYYELSGNKHYQIVCTSRLGGFYRMDRMDSAYYFIHKSIELSKSENDSTWLFNNYELLARAYWSDSLYQKQKDIALYIIKSAPKYATSDCFYDLCLAYAKLNMPDSAQYYYNLIPNKDCDDTEKVIRLLTLSNIESAKGNHKKALQLNNSYIHSSDSLTSTQLSRKLASVENYYDKQTINTRHRKEKSDYYIYAISIIALLVVLFIVLLFRHKRYIQRLNQLILELKQSQEEAERTIERNKEALNSINKENSIYKNQVQYSENVVKSIKAAFDLQFQRLKDIFILVDTNVTKDSIAKKKVKSILFNRISEDEISQFILYANLTHNNIIDKIKESYSNLKDEDIKLIALFVCDFPNAYIQLMMGYSNKQSVINHRRKIENKANFGMPLKDYISSFKTTKL